MIRVKVSTFQSGRQAFAVELGLYRRRVNISLSYWKCASRSVKYIQKELLERSDKKEVQCQKKIVYIFLTASRVVFLVHNIGKIESDIFPFEPL